jgi:hypothetical protein
MSLRKTQNVITHISQPGTAGTGAAHNGDDITAATTDVRGTVKKAAAVADISSPGSASAADAANKVNALLAALRAAGILDA